MPWCTGCAESTNGFTGIAAELNIGSVVLRNVSPDCLRTGGWGFVLRLDDGSRVSREVHARFCERLGVKFPRATHLVVLVDCHPRHEWLRRAVEQRIREELAKLRVEVNEEKSRTVDLREGKSFGFLGFDFRRIRSRAGRWMAQRLPQMQKRTELLRKLKAVFPRYRSHVTLELIDEINPVLRGWVAYFPVGHSSRCFSYVRRWVEKRIRRHLEKARQRRGFGWKRWSRRWLYEDLGLFRDYRITYLRPPKGAPA